jgi:hypothetical protein
MSILDLDLEFLNLRENFIFRISKAKILVDKNLNREKF